MEHVLVNENSSIGVMHESISRIEAFSLGWTLRGDKNLQGKALSH
jgi:hypothetical protein